MIAVFMKTDVDTIRRYARVAGFAYLIIIVCGLFAELAVRQALIAPGDPAQTASNVRNNELLFRTGIVADLVMVAADIVVALALYIVLAPVDRHLSRLAAFFRLVQASVLGANLINLVLALLLIGGTSLIAGQNESWISVYLEAHALGYLIGLVFFGVSCLIVGRLIVRSSYAPTWIGALIMVAGVGYLIDSFGQFLWAGYPEELSYAVLLPALVGEVSFCAWLIAKGSKIEV